MNEADARRVLLVQAIETADGEGRLLSPARRQEASDIVRAGLPAPGRTLAPREWSERFLVGRAQRLLQEAAARRSALQALAEPPRLGGAARWGLVLAAFAAGLMSDALANPGRINLLSLPLVGVVLWNWALLAGWLLARLTGLHRRARGAGVAGLGSLAAWPLRWRHGGAAVASTFGRLWARAAAPLAHARVKAVLHLGAAAVAAGLVAYVLARALPHEFRVGWESQLLKTPEEVHAFLRVLFLPLAPLAGVPGLEPFTLEEVARMHRWADTDPTLADRWLRLVTALLGVSVIAPRLLLALWQSRRARRLARRFPIKLTDPYFAGLLATGSGLRHRVEVWPYGVAADARRAQALAQQAAALFGPGTVVDLRPPTAYGDEAQALSAGRPAAAAAEGELLERAALLSLSATPEAETHGAFLQRLSQAAGGHAVALLDAGAFTARLGRGERLAERTSLWTDFAQRHGVARVHVVELGD